MSKTKRNFNDFKKKLFRRPKTLNQQKGLSSAVNALLEEGFTIKNRDQARANHKSKLIPSAWDDISIAAWDEYKFTLKPNK